MSDNSNMDLHELLEKPKAASSSRSLYKKMPAKMKRTDALKRHINSQRNSQRGGDLDLAHSSRVININFDMEPAQAKPGSNREPRKQP